MKTGILNNLNDDVLPISASNVVMKGGMTLDTYLNKLVNNIYMLILDSIPQFYSCNLPNYTLTASSVYETVTGDALYQRATENVDTHVSNMAYWDKDKSKFIVSADPTLLNIHLETRVDSAASAGNRFVKVNIYRDGSLFVSDYAAVNVEASKRGRITFDYTYVPLRDDEIEVQVYGSVGDAFSQMYINLSMYYSRKESVAII